MQRRILLGSIAFPALAPATLEQSVPAAAGLAGLARLHRFPSGAGHRPGPDAAGGQWRISRSCREADRAAPRAA
jgi:hypothetical protein